MPSNDLDTSRFPSLDELRAEHQTLLESLPESTLSEPDIRRIREFLGRAAATGAIIDTAVGRKQAQGFLDYWSATVASQARQRSDNADLQSVRLPRRETVLAEFQSQTISEVVAAADDWYQNVSEADRPSVRRILLSLVRLDDDGQTFRPEGATRAELHKLGAADRIDRLLNDLCATGVLRLEPGDDTNHDRFGLRFDAVSRRWTSYADWLDQRLRFRDAVRFWNASERNSTVLIRDELLDEARDYHDKSGLEEAFVIASRDREREENGRNQRAKYIFGGLAIIALAFALFAFRQWRRAEDETRRASGALAQATQARDLATEKEELAQREQAKAEKSAATLKAKSDLVNIISLIRTLAEIGTAGNEDEWQIAVQRLSFVMQGLQEDPDFASFLGGLEPEIARLKQDGASDGTRRMLAHRALAVGRSFRDRALELQDPDLIQELEAQRRVSYEMARFCGERIVSTLEDKTFGDADAYVREFWLLYWGELSVLEGKKVESAMVEFGNELKMLDQSVAKQLPEFEKLVDSMNHKWNARDQVRQSVSNLRSQMHLDESAQSVVLDLSRKKVPAAEVDTLRAILKEQLIPALEAELQEPLARSHALPTAY
jgi:hypothetical protein